MPRRVDGVSLLQSWSEASEKERKIKLIIDSNIIYIEYQGEAIKKNSRKHPEVKIDQPKWAKRNLILRIKHHTQD